VADTIRDLVRDAERRLDGLRRVLEKYPDARAGEVFGQPIVASKLALKDIDKVLLIVHRERGDNLLLPFVDVGGVSVVGWGDAGPPPFEVVMMRLRQKAPEAHAKLLEICRNWE
jgi:hypothetical protein